MRRAAKKDTTHNSIGDHLRSLGWSVLDLSCCGNGIPDMAVGRKGFAALVEAKTGRAKLTTKEQAVKDRFDGPFIVANSPEDAEAQLNALYP